MKNKIFIFMAVIMLLLQSGCNQFNKYQTEFTGIFDTVVTVVGYTKNQKEFTEVSEYIYSRLLELNNLFDIYKTYNDINNIKTVNDNAGIAPVTVDPVMIDLIKYSFHAYEITHGNVNIAMGSVLKIWHEAREQGNADPDFAHLPDMDLLTIAYQYTDINNIIVDELKNTLYITDKNTSIDLGAIAKGYAAELIAQELYAMGHTNFIVNLGGNVRALNNPKAIDGWTVGIQDPERSNQLIDQIKIGNLSVVTSGDYQRYYKVNGINYNHIINPQSLMPADLYKQVTVLCKDSAMADILSTALFIMPYEDGMKLSESFDAEVLWIFKDGSIQFTPGYSNYSLTY